MEMLSSLPMPATGTQWLIAVVLAAIAVFAIIALIKGIARMVMGLIAGGAALGLISVPSWPGVNLPF